MTRFLVGMLVMLVVPMTFLNPMGRPAFLGYYLGVVTMWVVARVVGQMQAVASSAPSPRG